MHPLKVITEVPADFLSQVINGKKQPRRRRLDALKPRLLKRYSVYEQLFTPEQLAQVTPSKWNGIAREDLIHCFSTSMKALVDLKNLIKANQKPDIRELCPYCGIGVANQFDHYLPKKTFPELSVHAYNLVPCCSTCNQLKSETWLTSGARTFLNFYIDSLPTASVLKVDLLWLKYHGKNLPKAKFSVVRPLGMSDPDFAQVKSHLTKLDLLGRYKDQTHSEYTGFRDSAVARKARTTGTLRTFLRDSIRERKKTLGPLNWKLVLYKTLMEYDPFLQECLK